MNTGTKTTRSDRFSIAWIMADRGVDGEAVRGFLTALDEGLSLGETDAVETLRSLRIEADAVGDPLLAEMRAMADDADAAEAALAGLARYRAVLADAARPPPDGGLASRIALETLRRRVSAAQ